MHDTNPLIALRKRALQRLSAVLFRPNHESERRIAPTVSRPKRSVKKEALLLTVAAFLGAATGHHYRAVDASEPNWGSPAIWGPLANVNRAGRLFGWGVSDGYHTSVRGSANPLDDLPIHSAWVEHPCGRRNLPITEKIIAELHSGAYVRPGFVNPYLDYSMPSPPPQAATPTRPGEYLPPDFSSPQWNPTQSPFPPAPPMSPLREEIRWQPAPTPVPTPRNPEKVPPSTPPSKGSLLTPGTIPGPQWEELRAPQPQPSPLPLAPSSQPPGGPPPHDKLAPPHTDSLQTDSLQTDSLQTWPDDVGPSEFGGNLRGPAASVLPGGRQLLTPDHSETPPPVIPPEEPLNRIPERTILPEPVAPIPEQREAVKPADSSPRGNLLREPPIAPGIDPLDEFRSPADPLRQTDRRQVPGIPKRLPRVSQRIVEPPKR